MKDVRLSPEFEEYLRTSLIVNADWIGWYFYLNPHKTFKEARLEKIIPSGPSRKLEDNGRYFFLPKTKNPKSPAKVLEQLERHEAYCKVEPFECIINYRHPVSLEGIQILQGEDIITYPEGYVLDIFSILRDFLMGGNRNRGYGAIEHTLPKEAFSQPNLFEEKHLKMLRDSISDDERDRCRSEFDEDLWDLRNETYKELGFYTLSQPVQIAMRKVERSQRKLEKRTIE